nr:unnamed protein product [Spirometra erinaceieuropaei]
MSTKSQHVHRDVRRHRVAFSPTVETGSENEADVQCAQTYPHESPTASGGNPREDRIMPTNKYTGRLKNVEVLCN